MKKEQLIRTALGQEKAELVFKHAEVVDVFCHKVVTCDVAVTEGRIIGVGEYSGEREIDCTGKYLMPSFIDTHVHIESSMLTPAEYAKAIMPKGVTMVVCDPHEIMNVCGEAGLRFMLDSAKTVPLYVHFMLPSCVPATKYDSSGCVIDSRMTKKLMENYEFLGLAEMMDYPSLLQCDPEILAKIEDVDMVDGHSPMLSGKELNAYICSGVRTDHECTTVEEALEKISKGMYVHIREGTGAKNLKELVKAINPYTYRRMTFCTDDKHIHDVAERGTISRCVNKAIENGIDPIDAITIASINAARCYGLRRLGAVAPNYRADLLLCDDLSAEHIRQVYKDGVLVAEDGKALFDGEAVPIAPVTDTIHIKPLKAGDLTLEFKPGMPAVRTFPETLITELAYPESAKNLSLCAVIERHKATGRIGKCFLEGVQVKHGAVAQSIGHDSHNITVIGDNEADMRLAVEALGRKGGIAVVKDGEVLAYLELAVAGLMSDKGMEEALADNTKVVESLKEICKTASSSLLMILSFISLVVIPEVKLNDRGLFHVLEQRFIER